MLSRKTFFVGAALLLIIVATETTLAEPPRIDISVAGQPGTTTERILASVEPDQTEPSNICPSDDTLFDHAGPPIWKTFEKARDDYDHAIAAGALKEAEKIARDMLDRWIQSCPPSDIGPLKYGAKPFFDTLVAFLTNALDRQGRHDEARHVPKYFVDAYKARYGDHHANYRLAVRRAIYLSTEVSDRLEFARTLVSVVRRDGPRSKALYVVLGDASLSAYQYLLEQVSPDFSFKNPKDALAVVREGLSFAEEGCALGSLIRAQRIISVPYSELGNSSSLGAKQPYSRTGLDSTCADVINFSYALLSWKQLLASASDVSHARDAAFSALQSQVQGRAGDGLARAAVMEAARAKGPATEAAAREWKDALNDLDRRTLALAKLNEENLAAQRRGQVRDEEKTRRFVEEYDRAEKRLKDALRELNGQVGNVADIAAVPAVTISQLQARSPSGNLLDESEALVVLQDTEWGLLIFAVSPQKVQWISVADASHDNWGDSFMAGAAVDKLRKAAIAGANGRGQAPESAFDRSAAFAVYRTLFANPQVADVIRDKGNLLIVPGDRFSSLSFSTLVTEQPVGPDADPASITHTKWLGLEKTIATLPSVGALRILKNATRKPGVGTEFVAFGDPDFRHGGDCSSLPPGDQPRVQCLPRLPGTRVELHSLQHLFGAPDANIKLGLDATEKTVRTHQKLASAKYVAFATHGLLSGDFEHSFAEPALALSPPAVVTDQSDDGLLTASEASELPLGSADMVILSACNTAAGASPGAEALSGLARAFLYAGAKSLLVSHWRVRDDAAAYFTTRSLYYVLYKGLSRPRALRQAIQDLIMQTPNTTDQTAKGLLDARSIPGAQHPGVWGAFFYVGVE